MRLRAVACLLVVALASPTLAADETPSSPRPTVKRSVDRLTGVWASDADPNGSIHAVAGANESWSLISFRKLSAVGFFENDEFIGFCREPQSGSGRETPYRDSILRLLLTGEDTARAEFSTAVGAPPIRTEQWRRVGRFGAPDSKSIVVVPPDSNSLPKLGEYVYVEELPEAVEKVPPDYPAWARARNISGTVMVQALVGTDGRVKDTRIVRSIPELDDYAIAAVKQWRFKPARTKTEPVAVWVAVPVKFTLH